MKQRKPMPRGKGFQRKAGNLELAKFRKSAPDSPPVEIEAACGLPAEIAEITRRPAPAVRRGTYASPDVRIRTLPKPEAHRNPHLLAMARGRPCLFRIPGVCCFDDTTSVACHSNLLIHGKAKSRKAQDEFSAIGCFACHSWLDVGPADAVTKELAFMAAHLAQVCEWRAIAGSAAAPIADRLAAQWALDHLNASPTGELP